MANLAGYDLASYGNMINHYTRHAGEPDQSKYRYRNVNIDQSRTHLNYAIYEKSANPENEIRRAINLVDVKPRSGTKATNVISDLIVTLPRNEKLQGREREFFEEVYKHLTENYVSEKFVLGAWVHMDETQPHMHFAFVPLVSSSAMTNDKNQPLKNADGTPKLDSKGTQRYKRIPKLDEQGNPIVRYSFGQSKIFNRKNLQQLHPRLEESLREHFGFVVGVQLEDEGEKQLSSLSQKQYIAAKETLRKQDEIISAKEAEINNLEAHKLKVQSVFANIKEEIKKEQVLSDSLNAEIAQKMIQKDSIEREIDEFLFKKEELIDRLESLRQEEAAELSEIAGIEAEIRDIELGYEINHAAQKAPQINKKIEKESVISPMSLSSKEREVSDAHATLVKERNKSEQHDLEAER